MVRFEIVIQRRLLRWVVTINDVEMVRTWSSTSAYRISARFLDIIGESLPIEERSKFFDAVEEAAEAAIKK